MLKSRTKVVLTGGPCSGKTSLLHPLADEFRRRGIAVVTVPESATELILSGISASSCGSVDVFQKLLMKHQLDKEAVYEEAAERIAAVSGLPMLIICDRGLSDSKAFMTPGAFGRAAADLGKTEEELMLAYDAVFHLTTAAGSGTGRYTLEDNPARTESEEESLLLDKKISEVWAVHPRRQVIGFSPDIGEKLAALVSAISCLINRRSPLVPRADLPACSP